VIRVQEGCYIIIQTNLCYYSFDIQTENLIETTINPSIENTAKSYIDLQILFYLCMFYIPRSLSGGFVQFHFIQVPAVAATLTWWSGLPIVMNQSSYTGWNNSSSRSYHARQVVVPWALQSRSNPISFLGTSRRTLPRCGQPGSDNCPHTSDSTQDHRIQNHLLSSIPIIAPTLTINSELPLLTSSSTKTLESRMIDVCCVSETRIQDPSVVIHLTSPRQNGEATKYTLRLSGDSIASSRGLAGVGIALSMRAEQALLEWIPVNSRLCAVRLNGSVRTRRNRDTRPNTNFRHKERHRLTWRPPSPRQRWTQIDHIAIIRARICLHLTGRRKATLGKPIRIDLSDEKVKSKFQEQLGSQLGNSGNQADPDVAWNDLKTAVETAASST
ncbi:acyl- :glycerol-3-phosphate acyltransferase, partial [Schistosoma japonicum]